MTIFEVDAIVLNSRPLASGVLIKDLSSDYTEPQMNRMYGPLLVFQKLFCVTFVLSLPETPNKWIFASKRK